MLDGIPSGTRFAAILADPPIAFDTWSPKGEGRSPQKRL
jgi:hypothetical protein